MLKKNEIEKVLPNIDMVLYKDFCDKYDIKSIQYADENVIKRLCIRYPFFDHAMMCYTKLGRRMVVVQPYLQDSECRMHLGNSTARKEDCEVLGKERSFYNPGETNLAVIYV